MKKLNLEITNGWSRFLTLSILLQLLLALTVIFNLFLARQVLGFIYFTFIPGFILLRILGLKKLELTETVLFSIGLSVTVLMPVGYVPAG